MLDTLTSSDTAAEGSEASADGAATAAAGDPPNSETGQATDETSEGQGAGKEEAADGGKPEGEAAEGAEGGETQGAPEAYADFSLPEGFELASDMLESLTATAKGLNLTQDQAQALVDLGVKQAQGILESVGQEPVPFAPKWHETWLEQTRADKEIGGDKLAAVLPVAKQALDTFANDAFTTLLRTTGLGSHPEVVRFLHGVGKALSEDGVVTRNGGEGRQTDTAKKLYPNMA